MKKTITLAARMFIFIFLMTACVLPVTAADSGQINYQARLLDAYGRRVNDTVDLTFTIYDASNNVLWTESQPGVVVQDGVYSVILGSQTPIPASVFSQNNIALELGIDGETMAPRQQITASAYALVARTIMGSNVFEDQTSGNVGVGTVAPSAKLDVRGTVQAAGFKMPTGATANYVLVSDSEGVGSWQSISVVITEVDPVHTNWVRVSFAPATNDLWTAIGQRATQVDLAAATNDMWNSAAGINARVLAATYAASTGALWAAVNQRMLRSGDIMTGPLSNEFGFFGNGIGLTNIPTGSIVLTGYVQRVGDTMSGQLVVSNNVTVSGTNQVNMLVVTNAIILQDLAAITNWNQVGQTSIVASLQNATGSLNTAVGSLNTSTGNLNTVVGDLNVSTASLNTAVGSLNTSTGSLNTAVANLNVSTASLNTAVANLNVSTATLNTAVANLNTATNSLNARAVRWDGAVLNKTGTAGDAIVFSHVYYFGVNGSWSNASAASSATARGMLGLALGSTIATDGMLVNGPCTNAWGFNSGSILYLATNANQITAARPTGTNHIVRIVGYAVDASTIFFNPDRTYIEIVGD